MIDELRSFFRDNGYTEDALRSLLGPPEARLSPAEQSAVWIHRARGGGALPTLTRLLLFCRPVALRAARTAFSPSGVKLLARAGLLRVHGSQALSLAQVSLHRGLFVLADPIGRKGRDLVLGPTGATFVLDRMMVRPTAARALDLGCGTGFLGFRLAAHTEEVIGTDTSPRALRWARLGATLNSCDNMRFLRGDRFGPVQDQRFDLIVGNLPFVISAGRDYSYRTGASDLDGFSRRVVAQAASFLRPAGVAQFLVQWASRADQPDAERLAGWLGAAPCKALFLRLESESAELHAARWSMGPAGMDGRGDGDERVKRLGQWAAYLARKRVAAVNTGLVTLVPARRSRAQLAELEGGEVDGQALVEAALHL